MPFMVIYRTSDGTSCHEQTDAIDEAALLVERLRNKDGIQEEIRIYRMEEISFAFRPYYKVELGLSERQAATTPPPEIVATAPAPPTDGPASTEPAAQDASAVPSADTLAATSDRPAPASHDDPESANGRRGLFGR